MKVADVMTAPVHTISSGKSVWHASSVMAERRIGSLVVVDAGEIAGIITSRDVRAAHPNRIVADAMTANPVCVAFDAFLWDALVLLERHEIERLIVMRDEKIAGMVTREAIVSKLAEWNDPMTGLYRSPYIHAIGEHLLSIGKPFQLLFIDLNRFGEVNKQFGHPVGDDLIREFAGRLLEFFDSEDHVCRYAGDEFAVITHKPDMTIGPIIRQLSAPVQIGVASISADTGWVNANSEPDFFGMSFRELISKASLLSTEAKQFVGR